MPTVAEQIDNSYEIIRLLRQHQIHLEIRMPAIRDKRDQSEMAVDIEACKRHITALRAGIKDALADRRGVKPGAGNGAAMANDPENIGRLIEIDGIQGATDIKQREAICLQYFPRVDGENKAAYFARILRDHHSHGEYDYDHAAYAAADFIEVYFRGL